MGSNDNGETIIACGKCTDYIIKIFSYQNQSYFKLMTCDTTNQTLEYLRWRVATSLARRRVLTLGGR